MTVKVERIELGPGQAWTFSHGAPSWAIVLPGAGYGAQAPLLWYARRAVLAAGRNAIVIADAFDRDRDDPIAWVEERARAALARVRSHDARPLLIGKSISSLAARLVAEEALPAVWLTPLIAQGSEASTAVLPGLYAAAEPRLLVGGTNDSTWDSAAAASLTNADVLELVGADHSLEVADDVSRSLDYLARVTDEIGRFIAALT